MRSGALRQSQAFGAPRLPGRLKAELQTYRAFRVMELSPRREPLEQVFMRLTEEDEPKSKQSTTQKITRDELSSRAPASAGS